MSDIKIPGSLKDIDVIDNVSDTVEKTSRTDDVEALDTPKVDTVEQIVRDVASGAISRDQAVDRLLADVLDSSMIQSAPRALRDGLREALETLLETDPHLGALKSAIGPSEIE